MANIVRHVTVTSKDASYVNRIVDDHGHEVGPTNLWIRAVPATA
jgi:hypothetical protein